MFAFFAVLVAFPVVLCSGTVGCDGSGPARQSPLTWLIVLVSFDAVNAQL